jgi:hypothetical protein
VKGYDVEGDGRGTWSKTVFAFTVGALYVLFGGLQLVEGLGLGDGWSRALLLGGGAMDGAVMVIIGLVFLQGHRELRSGVREGVAFVYVGILLAAFFLLVQVSQVSASYLGAWTVGGEWEGYSAIDTVSPFLYLSPLPVAGLLVWRGGFTLRPKGSPGGNGVGLIKLKED